MIHWLARVMLYKFDNMVGNVQKKAFLRLYPKRARGQLQFHKSHEWFVKRINCTANSKYVTGYVVPIRPTPQI